ncbi:MAG: hypothetical protein IT239_01125 [Bacteroidia bacterium]|nr:hypothetical protein [Bacteroidia bacterium]
MKGLLLATIAFSFIFLASCTRCSKCDVTVSQTALGNTKVSTYEKCGKSKDLNTFESDVKETYKPYGKEATVNCVRN